MKNARGFSTTIMIAVLLMSSKALKFFWTRTIFGNWFQQLFFHSTTLMTDSLCPIKTLNQQLTNLEQPQIRCSLHCKRWTVNGIDCASVLHSFKGTTYLRVNETAATVEGLSDLLKPGAMDGFLPFAMKFNCIQVKLFVSIVVFLLFAGAIFVAFFEKFTFFCSLSLMTFS